MGTNLSIINNIKKKYLNKINKGIFIECGAIDGVYRSITKTLYDNGWRGYNFEPNSITYAKLIKNRKEDVNINMCLWDKNGDVEFNIPKGHQRGYETGTGSILKKSIKDREHIIEKVKSITFDRFIYEYNVNKIDFMVLDVEGAELSVLSRFKHSNILPMYLLVEAVHVNEKKLYEILNNFYVEDKKINVGNENKFFILKKLFL